MNVRWYFNKLPFYEYLQVAVVTGVVAIHNINEYILDNYAVPSDEAFLYYKTGKHCNRNKLRINYWLLSFLHSWTLISLYILGH